MKFGFRCDAGIEIGTGHFMRCLSLAREIQKRGVDVSFFFRHMPDHFVETLESENFTAIRLSDGRQIKQSETIYQKWLGVSEIDDADNFLKLAGPEGPFDFLIVDHYGISYLWEIAVRPLCEKIVVIDDLANRDHQCDWLIDTNLNEDFQNRYAKRIPSDCRELLGPRYAMLRPEFRQIREAMPAREFGLNRILVSLGGVDAENYTANALQVVEMSDLNAEVDVVIGRSNPHQNELSEICQNNNYNLHVQTNEIAKLMADADLCIGAAGSSTWERMCLGLPCLTLCVADNQRLALDCLVAEGLAYAPNIDIRDQSQFYDVFQSFISNAYLRRELSERGQELVDGLGVKRIVDHFFEDG